MAKSKAVPVKSPTATTRVSPRGQGKNLGYQFTRAELNLLMPQYMLIRDAIAGEMAIKGMYGSGSVFPLISGQNTFSCSINTARAKVYLPQPNAEDTSNENKQRYLAYVQRAVWYGVTARTLEGMSGQVFLRDPDKTIPTQLEILNTDADGSGKTLDQVAGKAVRDCIAYSRCGLLVDYPVTNNSVTKQQVDSGDIRPVIMSYEPWQIVNWTITTIGTKKVLTQVVLCEYLDGLSDDGFSVTTARRWRVLSLDPTSGNHYVRVFAEGDDVANPSGGNYIPTNSKGKPFNYIPFFFVGAKDNDANPDKPLLYDLASLNIAHYRNSADYEESCFICGQPTPVLSGLDVSWVETVLKGKITLGSRGSVPLPTGAKMELIQAQPNSMPMEAMKEKEQQMVALGAKIVQVQKVQKTATQQINETTSESSPLQNVARNVSAAMVEALKVAAEFTGADEASIKYILNTDYDLTSMTADDQNAVVLQWQSAAIARTEMRRVLKRAGTAFMDDNEAKKEIEQDIKDGLIPDPAQSAQPAGKAPLPKAPSSAGGPQPGAPRPTARPGTTN